MSNIQYVLLGVVLASFCIVVFDRPSSIPAVFTQNETTSSGQRDPPAEPEESPSEEDIDLSTRSLLNLTYKKIRTGFGHVRLYNHTFNHGDILVLMSGHMRTYRVTLPTIREKYLRPNNAPVVLASYDTEGYKIFREAELLKGSYVDYDEVAQQLLTPFVKVMHVVSNNKFVAQDTAQHGIDPLFVPALSQFFIMELAMNTSTEYASLVGIDLSKIKLYVRLRPDMYVLGRSVIHSLLENGNWLQNYTCNAMRHYLVEWDSEFQVLVSPHHPVFRWKELFTDHTITLKKERGEKFFRLYTHVLKNPNPFLSRKTAERMWLMYLKALGVRDTNIIRVPGWHVVFRNQSNFIGKSKSANKNEMTVFGTISVKKIGCPHPNGTQFDVQKTGTMTLRRIISSVPSSGGTQIVRAQVRVRGAGKKRIKP
eukprot:PhF_6_TR21664/c0_g1_i1/m.30908